MRSTENERNIHDWLRSQRQPAPNLNITLLLSQNNIGPVSFEFDHYMRSLIDTYVYRIWIRPFALKHAVYSLWKSSP